MNQQVTISKDDLKELIFEYVKSDRNLSSNFIGEFSKKMDKMDEKIDLHTVQLTEQNISLANVSKNVESLTDKFDDIKTKQDSYDGEKKGTMAIVGIAFLIIGSLISVIWYSQSGRIDKIESKIYAVR